MIRWCQKRGGLVIGDFGCGEAKLAEALAGRHTVHSFDHVAVNDAVVACDMAHVPLGDETLDVAIFSLSLMGANFTDYLREAHGRENWTGVCTSSSRPRVSRIGNGS